MASLDNKIPEDKLPPCWADDVRMNALFAPFRIKSANPESWDMKMKFWSDMLRQWCKYKSDPVVSASDAKFAFQRKGRTPACIEIVVEEMIRNGELSPVSKYTQILQNGPEGWVKWSARLAFKPASFALTAAVSLLPARQSLDSDGLPKANIDPTHRFVLESAVKEQATYFLDNYPPDEERVGRIEELMRRSGWTHSQDTLEVLLGWLVAQGMATRKDDVIKLAIPSKKVTPISEADEALAKLMSAEERLTLDMARLEKELAGCQIEARAALQMGNKLAAKNHLRKKHKVQQRLDRCESALDNIRQLLLHMRDVDTNAAIVDTYRTSSEAMKRGMKETGLDEDVVHETMDDLKEVLETYSEVERALSATSDDCDAAELEQELKDLLSAPATPVRSPGRHNKPVPGPSPKKPSPRISEREFIFDGEERMIAELNALDIDATRERREGDRERRTAGEGKREKVAVADWGVPEKSPLKPKESKSWYPPSNQFLKDTWNNNPEEREVRQDDRLHPGQPLDLDFATPPRLYNTDFQVRDHKMADGVWLFNKDSNSNDDISGSTEYFSPEMNTTNTIGFQMAPGGERRPSTQWATDSTTGLDAVEELERRLRNLKNL